MINIRKVRKTNQMTMWERLYLFEVARGFYTTTKHFLYNFPKHVWIFGWERLVNKKPPQGEYPFTIQYPDEKRKYPERYRGIHRLLKREDDSPKCVACYMCATVCPAQCIHITAEAHDDPQIEKQPQRFVIDSMRCIYCGFCVEACPKDAIRMDTGKHTPVHRSKNAGAKNLPFMKEVISQEEEDDSQYTFRIKF